MTGPFEVIAHENHDGQQATRRAVAAAAARTEGRFGKFLAAAIDGDDFDARFDFVRDEIETITREAGTEYGAWSETADLDFITKVIVGEGLRSRYITERQDRSLLNTAMAKNGHRQDLVRTARKPKLCPYHSEVVDISLAQGEPQAGFNAMAQHAWGDKHCQGEYEGGCNFKREMVTQSYWDDKAEKAEERKREREEAFQTPEVTEIEPSPPDVPEVTETETVEEDTGAWDDDGGAQDVAEPEPAMAMAASRAPLGGSQSSFTKEAPGSEHMKGVSPKRNRMYEHIKEQCLADGGSEDECKEKAARTVNKYRSEHGETKSHVTADTATGPNVVEGPGKAVPEMNKRKWRPTREPFDAQSPGSPRPTHHKDPVKPIKSDQGTRANPSELSEIGEGTTEKQDVTQDSGFSRGEQGGVFPKGPQANPVS